MMPAAREMLQRKVAERLLRAGRWTGLRGTCEGPDQTLLSCHHPSSRRKDQRAGKPCLTGANLRSEGFPTGRKMAGST